jgi:hypothetical protein
VLAHERPDVGQEALGLLLFRRQHLQAEPGRVEAVLPLHQERRDPALPFRHQEQPRRDAGHGPVAVELHDGAPNRPHRDPEPEVVHQSGERHLRVAHVPAEAHQPMLHALALEVDVEGELEVGEVVRRDRLAGDWEGGRVLAEVLAQHRLERRALAVHVDRGPLREPGEGLGELLR